MPSIRHLAAPAAAIVLCAPQAAWAADDHAVLAKGERAYRAEFPGTDFDKRSIELSEIVTDGPIRDSIPPIDKPKFMSVADAGHIGAFEPVVSVTIDGDARAYPLRILLWHEIVNDVVGGVPILVSYCPLCNSGVVFDRRLAGLPGGRPGGRLLSFGNTGRIRHYDMVMYDHETESWWQQFLGEAIVGELVGQRLKAIPSRLESMGRFRARAPKGKLLLPDDRKARAYGTSPYVDFERGSPAFPYKLPEGVRMLDRVVVVGDEAWTLRLVRRRRRIEAGDLVLTWEAGQNSIHDAKIIAFGRDVGNVVVQRREGGPGGKEGKLVDAVYDMAFAFAFRAFRPEGRLYTK